MLGRSDLAAPLSPPTSPTSEWFPGLMNGSQRSVLRYDDDDDDDDGDDSDDDDGDDNDDDDDDDDGDDDDDDDDKKLCRSAFDVK